MAVRLTIRDDRLASESFTRTFLEHRIRIGRSRTCHVCLPDLLVSSIHLEIRLDGVGYTATDLGSLNGTRVGSRRLIPYRPRVLSNDNVLRIANYEISFCLGVVAEGMPDRNLSQTQARRMLSSLLAGDPYAEMPSLVVLSGPSGAARYELPPPPSQTVIGSGRQDAIRLSDPKVARNHVEVECENRTVTVRRLGPAKGLIRVNDEIVESTTLHAGDILQMGQTRLALEYSIDPLLLSIQGAPEAETSSFSPVTGDETTDDPVTAELERTPDRDDALESEPPLLQLPTGPEDPLIPMDTADYVQTREFPGLQAEKSDTGLIVVGALLVILCVLVLFWLLS